MAGTLGWARKWWRKSAGPRSYSRRRAPLWIERLERRMVLSAPTPQLFLNPNPTDLAAGSFLANGAEYAQVIVPDGRLTATATGVGTLATSLALLDSKGALLTQSDGQVGNATDLITQYLPAGTYYLKISGLGGAGGSFSVTASVQSGVLPLKNIPFGQNNGANPAMISGVFTTSGHLDLVAVDPNTNTVAIMLGNGDGTFQSAVAYSVNPDPAANPGPVEAVAGYFGNTDTFGHKILDLATVNTDGTVSVLLGRGDGTFLPAQVISLGPNATTDTSAIIAVDLGNGNVDLVMAVQFVDRSGNNLASGTVAVLKGNGTGTFQAMPLNAVGQDPSYVVAANFGDGHLDLATADDDTVSVLRGHGDGTFQVATAYNLDTNGNSAIPFELVAADFGNGHIDLAAVDAGTNGVSVLLGKGDGTFRPAVFYPVGSNPQSIVAANFGNGHVDLVTANFGDPNNSNFGLVSDTVSVLIGRGDGTFLPATQYQIAGSGPNDLVAADFGNGHLDLATADFASDTVSVLLGNGDGTFQKSTAYASAIGPVSLLVGDFGNGHVDIATVNDAMPDASGAEAVSVLLGNGDGSFQSSPRYQIGTAPTFVLTTNLGNGHPDLVTSNYSANTISVVLGNGDATFQPAVNYAAGSRPDFIVAADFNNDGHLDLAVSDQGTDAGSSAISILLGNGDGTFQKAVTYSVGAFPDSLVVGDFGNGHLDLASVNASGTVSILLGNGKGTFGKATNYATGIAGATSIVAADFSNGHLDLAVANPGTGALSVLLGRGNGTFRNGVVVAAGAGPQDGVNRLQGIVAGDFGNGHIDLAIPDKNASAVLVFLGNGNGTFQTAVPYAVGVNPVGIIGVELGNTTVLGAPILDLATVNDPDDGSAGSVSVLVGKGNGTFNAAVSHAAEAGADVIAAGRFNGNQGLAVTNNADETISVFLGNGDGTVNPATDYDAGDAPNFLVAGDFGNGSIDLAATNFNGATLTVLLNAGNGLFVPSSTVVPQKAVPLLADFTGTGVLDAVIVDQSGNILYRQGSATTPGTFSSPVVVNPSSPARAAALVATTQGESIAALDNGSNTVSLYRRNSDGTFTNVGTLTPGPSPTRIEAADLNGDGHGDLAVLNSDGTVTIYLENGLGGFLPGNSYNVGLGASSLSVAPDAATGAIDILATNQMSGDVTVLVNNGAGTITQVNRYRAGAGPYSFDNNTVVSYQGTVGATAGPLASAGPTAVVAINAGAQTYGVLQGQGGGSFLNPVVSAPLGFSPAFIAGGDFANNGHLDFALFNKAAGTIVVFVGDGHGGFTQKFAVDASGNPIPLNVGAAATGIAVADVNGDHNLDLVVSNAYGDLQVLLGNGDGTFRYLDTQSQIPLAATRLNGKDVFVYANSSLNHISLQYGGTAPAVFQGLQNGILNPGAVKLADLNGDGIKDLIVVDSGRNSVLVYPGLGNGKFGPELHGGQGFAVGDDPVSVTVGDLSGTGRIGLVIANRGSNDVSLLYVAKQGAGWTLSAGPRIKTGGRGPTSAVIAAVSGNGLPDIIATNQDSNNVALMPGVGNGFFKDATQTFGVGLSPAKILLLNTPTGLEMATIDSGSGTVTMFDFIGGGFNPLGSVSSGGTNPVDAITVSINGTEDLVIANNGNGLATLLVNGENGLQIVAEAALPNASSLADISDSSGLQIYGTSVGIESAQLLFSFGIAPPSAVGGETTEVVGSGASLEGANLPVGVLLLSVAAEPGGVASANAEAAEAAAFSTGFFLGASRGNAFGGAAQSGDDTETALEVAEAGPTDEMPGVVPQPQLPLIKFLTGIPIASADRAEGEAPLVLHPLQAQDETLLFEAPTRDSLPTTVPAAMPETRVGFVAKAESAPGEHTVPAPAAAQPEPAAMTASTDEHTSYSEEPGLVVPVVDAWMWPHTSLDAEHRAAGSPWTYALSGIAISGLAYLWREDPEFDDRRGGSECLIPRRN
jgi:hypothetical protein